MRAFSPKLHKSRSLATIEEEFLKEAESSDDEPANKKKLLRFGVGKNRFGKALKKVKKNAAWIQPPDPPVVFSYMDPADTPPGGHFVASRAYASAAILHMMPKANANVSADEGEAPTAVPRIYIFGGETASGKRMRRIDYFDCNTNQWVKQKKTPTAGGIWPRRRIKSAMAAVNNHLLCIFGGTYHGEAEYLPVNDCAREEPVRHRRTMKDYSDSFKLMETSLTLSKRYIKSHKPAYLADLHIYNAAEDSMLDFYKELPTHNRIHNRIIPEKRAGHSLLYLNTFLYDEKFEQLLAGVGGGMSSSREEPGSSRLEDSTEDGGPTLLRVIPIPDPWEQEKMKSFKSTGSVVLFGGERSPESEKRSLHLKPAPGDDIHREPNVCFNDIWRFDFAELKWYEIQTAGEKPPPTTNHSATIQGNSMFIYGGLGESQCVWASLYELKFTPYDWMSYDFEDEKLGKKDPELRQRMIEEASMGIKGDVGTFHWHCINLLPVVQHLGKNAFAPSFIQSGALFKDPSNDSRIIAYGGLTSEGVTWRHTDLPVFDVRKRRWVKSQACRSPPKTQAGQICVVDDRNMKVWLWGGINVEDDGLYAGKFPATDSEEANAQSRELLKHEERVIKIFGPSAECLPPVRVPLNSLVQSKLSMWGRRRLDLVDELEKLHQVTPTQKYSQVKALLDRSERIRHKVGGLTQTMSGAIRRPWTVVQNKTQEAAKKRPQTSFALNTKPNRVKRRLGGKRMSTTSATLRTASREGKFAKDMVEQRNISEGTTAMMMPTISTSNVATKTFEVMSPKFKTM